MIVTITRQTGARGEAVGRAAAEELGWQYLDGEIMTWAAARANVSVETIEQAQRVPSLLTRMMEALGRYPAGFELAEVAPGIPLAPPLSSDAYRQFVEQVFHQLVESTDAVIVGHAAQAVLRRSAGVLHVLVVAPVDERARLVASEEHLSREEAVRAVQARDAERGEFLRHYYQTRWLNAAVYDLVLNTGRLPASDAAGLIVELVHARQESS